MKNILKKIEQFKHSKIELSVIDDAKKKIQEVNQFESNVSKMKVESDKAMKLFKDAISLKDSLSKQYDDNKKQIDTYRKQLNDTFKTINNQAKELGLNVNDLPVYKEYLTASDKLNSYGELVQDNWSEISQY